VVGAATEKSATGQFGVYARNDEHRSIGRAQSPRWCQKLLLQRGTDNKFWLTERSDC